MQRLTVILSMLVLCSPACSSGAFVRATPTPNPSLPPTPSVFSAPPDVNNESKSPSPNSLQEPAPTSNGTSSPCGNGVCEGPENPRNCPEDCATAPDPAQVSLTSTPVETSKEQIAVLYLGIMVHLEGWNDAENQARFEHHAQLMRDYATLFENYGTKLTWESKEVTDGVIQWGDNVLLEMKKRGHGVGVHADIGGQKNYACRRFADDLQQEKEKLDSLGVTVRHVSGIVSHCDWVTAASEAGYLFTTGQVAYAVMSMPPESRPPEFRNCQSPAACHNTFPTSLEERLHPWRMNNGADWLTPVPTGRLVLLASSGGLACMEEDAKGVSCAGNKEEKNFTEADIDYFIRELEQAIALAKPGQVNSYYVSWSLGAPLDQQLLETWLQRIAPYVESGQVAWKTLPEVYDAYIQWETTQ